MLEDNISDITQRGNIWSQPKGCEELSLPPGGCKGPGVFPAPRVIPIILFPLSIPWLVLFSP